jgi:hypothetical protein
MSNNFYVVIFYDDIKLIDVLIHNNDRTLTLFHLTGDHPKERVHDLQLVETASRRARH